MGINTIQQELQPKPSSRKWFIILVFIYIFLMLFIGYIRIENSWDTKILRGECKIDKTCGRITSLKCSNELKYFGKYDAYVSNITNETISVCSDICYLIDPGCDNCPPSLWDCKE